MLKFNCVLHNLWAKENFDSLWNKSGSFTKNKHWEIELTKYSNYFLGIRLDACWRGRDHAGFSVELMLLGYCFHVNIYDSRHWDYENNCWEIYTGEHE